MSSLFKVPLTTIREIQAHPNADKLEIAVVYGFSVIVKKEAYKVGDEVIYIPIDSILPQKLEDHIFPPGSKIVLDKHRVRQIRIRKTPSQGMLINPTDIETVFGFTPNVLEQDYADILGVKKYTPPEQKGPAGKPGGRKAKEDENPLFHKYNGLDNIKWYPEKFKNDEMVVIQEKIHGMNARAALMPYVANTFWKKVKKFLKLTPEYEFCYGSNNVQIQAKRNYTGYYGEDIHGKVFKNLGVDMLIRKGETIYGEIYGDGIQKNYSYGCQPGEHKFVLFDVKVLQEDGTQKWLNPDEVEAYAKDRGFQTVPTLYRGMFNLDIAKQLTIGNSVLCPTQKVREGVVVKSLTNYDEFGNKRALKVISEEYLDDSSNTDFQ